MKVLICLLDNKRSGCQKYFQIQFPKFLKNPNKRENKNNI